MGLDGGTYITRSDVLRGQSWKLNKADKSRSTRGGAVKGVPKGSEALNLKDERRIKWTTCSLSERPLQNPIVADYLGNLYNYEAVIEFLLGRSGKFADCAAEHRYLNQLQAQASCVEHLHTKRDTFTIYLREANSATGQPEHRESNATDLFCCPVTDVPCDSFPFSALSSCGHVFSDRCLQQMSEKSCSICSKSFEDDNVIPVNGSKEQVARLRERLKEKNDLNFKGKAKRKRSKESIDKVLPAPKSAKLALLSAM